MDFRRVFALIAACLIALPSWAQEKGKTWRVGMLETVPRTLNSANVEGLLKGLRELGYVEGRNLALHYRSADGRPERFPELANTLVREKVDLIVTRGTPATRAAVAATSTIPIVMASVGSPERTGLVKSLAHPGGNVSGLSANSLDLAGKRLELIKTILPRISHVGFLANMSSSLNQTVWRDTEKSARALHIKAELLDVRKVDDLPTAFESAKKKRLGAVIVAPDTLTQTNRKALSEIALQHRVPTMGSNTEFVAAGGLLSYSGDIPRMYYRVATYVDKIFKGAKAGDLPVEEPATLELVINLKTAKALGITLPPEIKLRADRFIQ